MDGNGHVVGAATPLRSSHAAQDKKRSLLSAIVTRLQAAGTDPNDVMVFFGEIDRANISFGGGRHDVRPVPGDGR